MTHCHIGRLLLALLSVAIFVICAGQGRSGQIRPPYVKQMKGMDNVQRSIFSCNFNVTGDYFFSWAVNGVAISNATNVFKEEYKDDYIVITSDLFGSLLGRNVPFEHHLFNFTCRLYPDDEFVTNSQIEPAYETAMATLRVINKPSESDPICELDLIKDQMDQPLIEVNCCVHLTRETTMSVSLIQGTVRWYRNKTEFVEDLSESRQQCFKHTVAESALSAGNFQCILDGEVFGTEQKCKFQSFKPKITLSRIEDNYAHLTCTYEASNIVGYTWSVDKDVEYELSDDSKHFYTSNKDRKTITVSCTVFTKSGYGSAKLQIIAEQIPPYTLANQSILIIVGCALASIIILLFLVVIAYLIVIRGICFCFRPPDRYTEHDLRRMQLERESIAHFKTLHNNHSSEGVHLVIQNGGHRYHAASSADNDIPPVPGGNAQFSSHLLDYADLDHGNTPSDDMEDTPTPPQRSDNTKVEYADILKPPTTSLRDMS